MADSRLVKNIKKLERMAKKATKHDSIDTPNGYADETLDHIYEVAHEAMIKINELEKEERDAAEVEGLPNRRPEPVYQPGGLVWNDQPWVHHYLSDGSRRHVIRYGFRYFFPHTHRKCSDKNCIVNAPEEIKLRYRKEFPGKYI